MDSALDLNDGFHVRLPIRTSHGWRGVEDTDKTGFVPITFVFIDRPAAGEDFGLVAAGRNPAKKSMRVAFELDDQMNTRCLCRLECFFWQCRASSVMM